jgi:hypothetical protein
MRQDIILLSGDGVFDLLFALASIVIFVLTVIFFAAG